MKGVILAGGSGTRLRPITSVVCKQLLPVYDKPMIYYPLSTLIHAGVTEIAVVSSPEEVENFRKLLGTGRQWGISIQYLVQPKPEGLPQGITLAEDFIGNDSFWFILGDNLFHGPNFGPALKTIISENGQSANIFAYRVQNSSPYGVVDFRDGTDEIIGITEKPKGEMPGWAIPGLYFFPNCAVRMSRSLEPSSRGELEIADLLEAFYENSNLSVMKVSRGNAWFDLGTAENLLTGSNFVHAIQSRQGLLIGSPEEATFHSGNIDSQTFAGLVENQYENSYFETLRNQ